MGLLDSLKSTFTSTGEASVPPAASFATREGVIYAPVNGVLVNLAERQGRHRLCAGTELRL